MYQRNIGVGLNVAFLAIALQCFPFCEPSLQNKIQPDAKLILVQVVFRHGDRTPCWFYKKDRYQPKDFPEGKCRLINRGKERLFKSGQVFRERYHQYLESVQPREVYAESSPSTRCMLSMTSWLAGVFPPSGSHVWSQSVALAQMWQPIAVRTVTLARAWKLKASTPCPKAHHIEKFTITHVPELANFLASNRQFIDNLSLVTGENFHRKIWSLVGQLYDTLDTEQQVLGSAWVRPEWLTSKVEETLKQFGDYFFSIYGQSPEYIKLRAGTLINELINNQKAAVAKDGYQKIKLFAYASHDSFISLLMHALGLFRGRPDYGSGLIFELRHDVRTDSKNVHLFYSNVTDNFQIYPLPLNDSDRFRDLCPEVHCLLENFTTGLEVYFLNGDVEEQCQFDNAHVRPLSAL